MIDPVAIEVGTRQLAVRPILFSGPMVRALIAGTKTQTRRVCKPAANLSAVVAVQDPTSTEIGQRPPYLTPGWFGDEEGEVQFFCPHGAPGDRLWVRESWACDDEDGVIMYRADIGQGGDADEWERGRREGLPRYRWRAGIHMPRVASRIILEIVCVRVERLQDISEADALAEGVDMQMPVEMPFASSIEFCTVTMKPRTAREAYLHLWESINGEASWDANPWVWVVSFQPAVELYLLDLPDPSKEKP